MLYAITVSTPPPITTPITAATAVDAANDRGILTVASANFGGGNSTNDEQLHHALMSLRLGS